MIIEIDQSGRIEETNKPTIIGATNKIKTSLKISAAEKRRLLKQLTKVKPKWGGPRAKALIFAELIVLTLNNHVTKETTLIIDPEYPGYENEIKNWLLLKLQKRGLHKKAILFSQVGKHSNAHILANKTFRRILKPDREIGAESFLRNL